MDSKEREAVKQRTHFLKTWPEHFEAVMSGAKRFELRVNDRDFRVGDRLELAEFDPGLDGGFTGRECDVDVIHILHGGAFGLPEGHVIMSIAKADAILALRPAGEVVAFKVGDVVTITHAVHKSRGWSDAWVDPMDDMIGKSGMIEAEEYGGYRIGKYNFPPEALRLSQAAPPISATERESA